jgi:hypothetical protein
LSETAGEKKHAEKSRCVQGEKQPGQWRKGGVKLTKEEAEYTEKYSLYSSTSIRLFPPVMNQAR